MRSDFPVFDMLTAKSTSYRTLVGQDGILRPILNRPAAALVSAQTGRQSAAVFHPCPTSSKIQSSTQHDLTRGSIALDRGHRAVTPRSRQVGVGITEVRLTEQVLRRRHDRELQALGNRKGLPQRQVVHVQTRTF